MFSKNNASALSSLLLLLKATIIEMIV